MPNKKNNNFKFQSKIINIKFFLISFLVGLFYIYFFDDKKIVYVYPTPHNTNNVQYVDKSENCYTYKFKKTKCPKDTNKINTIPVQ